MLELLQESWQAIREDLRREVGAGPFDAWLEDLEPVALERSVAYLEARTRMVADRAGKLYGAVLGAALSKEIGTHIVVQVMAAPEAEAPDRLEVGPLRPVVDESNNTAYLVLKSLLDDRPLPGSLYLFHGAEGTGKSFLLRWWLQHFGKNAMAFEAQHLTKVFQAVARDRRYAELRDELQRDRPLVIDEFHRLRGKRRLQRELLEVLHHRHEGSAPTVLASRWHPNQIHDLEPSLRSMLLSGFVCSLEAPGPAGRLRYLRALEGAPSRNGRKAEVERLAQQVQGNYREIRAAWLAEREDRQAEGPRKYLELFEPRSLFDRLTKRVCAALQVERDELMGRSQVRRISLARKVLAWMCVQEGLTRAEVGRFMNGRSRAAISYLTRRLEDDMAADAAVRAQVEALL